jgi:hypothetical protein
VPKIKKTQVESKKTQEEVIYNSPTPVKTKLHTSLATLKALMLKTLATNIEKIKTISDARLIIGISSNNERKT